MKEAMAEGAIDRQPDGSLAVVGCCGQCYVLKEIQYCPFCGTPGWYVAAIEACRAQTGETDSEQA
jgi:hypothetical protein